MSDPNVNVKDQLRRLAIAVETLATIVLERMPSTHPPPRITKRPPASLNYWIKYVIGPIAIGLSTAIIARFLGK